MKEGIGFCYAWVENQITFEFDSNQASESSFSLNILSTKILHLNSTVSIAPEAFPSLQLPSFEYAEVTRVDMERGRFTLRRIGTGGS